MCLIEKSNNASFYDSANFRPPSMSQLVGQTISNRRVSCMDLALKASVALVGISLLAISVILLIQNLNLKGFTLSTLPFNGLLALVSVGGALLTYVSVSRMVDLYQKKQDFESRSLDV